MQATRIPEFTDKSRDGMSNWFAAMASRGLLFHPEDDAASIVHIKTGEPVFTSNESARLDAILADMFERHGSTVCDAVYPVFMEAAGLSRST